VVNFLTIGFVAWRISKIFVKEEASVFPLYLILPNAKASDDR
jgi:hypothetical protein